MLKPFVLIIALVMTLLSAPAHATSYSSSAWLDWSRLTFSGINANFFRLVGGGQVHENFVTDRLDGPNFEGGTRFPWETGQRIPIPSLCRALA
jgi:hypothetical protein